jgi:hypothetical protein
MKSHFGVHLKQEFVPANVGRHDNSWQVLEAPGRGPLLIDQGVRGALHEDTGRRNVGQGGPFRPDESRDLVKGAVDLGPDISGMEALPLRIDGRSAGYLDQETSGCRMSAPREKAEP